MCVCLRVCVCVFVCYGKLKVNGSLNLMIFAINLTTLAFLKDTNYYHVICVFIPTEQAGKEKRQAWSYMISKPRKRRKERMSCWINYQTLNLFNTYDFVFSVLSTQTTQTLATFMEKTRVHYFYIIFFHYEKSRNIN